MSQTHFTTTPSGGFGTMLDLSLTRFITIGMIKVIYILAMVCLGLTWLGVVLTSVRGGFLGFLVGFVAATVVSVLYLLMVRVWLELIVVIFRIGENTSMMAGRSMYAGAQQGFPVEAVPLPAANR